ncbi:hypothetical protein AR687_10810 [Flavobacteriaceae bacterium CRH]|nr:hypothetical protein AR687_10810 [Flavobacteriaceae bacterium CRH]
MILPTKTIEPVDSLISISAFIIEILRTESMDIDSLLKIFNEKYYKEITIEKMLLAIDFLFITDSIKYNNGIIKINI